MVLPLAHVHMLAGSQIRSSEEVLKSLHTGAMPSQYAPFTSRLFVPIPRLRRLAWSQNTFGGISIARRLWLMWSYSIRVGGYSYSLEEASAICWTYFRHSTWFREMGLDSHTRDYFAELSGRVAYIQGWARVMLARLARRRKIESEFAPGGPGYLRARENFQILAGQRRKTRRFKPY